MLRKPLGNFGPWTPPDLGEHLFGDYWRGYLLDFGQEAAAGTPRRAVGAEETASIRKCVVGNRPVVNRLTAVTAVALIVDAHGS
jgi:hypothetical protein